MPRFWYALITLDKKLYTIATVMGDLLLIIMSIAYLLYNIVQILYFIQV